MLTHLTPLVAAADPDPLGFLSLGDLAKSVLLIAGVAIVVSLLILGASYIGVWLDDREARR